MQRTDGEKQALTKRKKLDYFSWSGREKLNLFVGAFGHIEVTSFWSVSVRCLGIRFALLKRRSNIGGNS